MTTYESYMSRVDGVVDTLYSVYLYPIIEEAFRQDRGYKINETLPDRQNEEYHFNLNYSSVSADVFESDRSIENVMYNGFNISETMVSGHPGIFSNLPYEISDMWWEVFGTNPHEKGHPGELPHKTEDMEMWFESLSDELKLVTAEPSIDDVANCAIDRNTRVFSHFTGIEFEDLELMNSNNELAELFINGEVVELYRGDDICLLKPRYNHRERATRMNIPRVNFNADTLPEPAFVLGLDDTPHGVFGHMVDGTSLDYRQRPNRGQIHEAMGYDTNYNGEELIELNEGERRRLQGDLAVECISESTRRPELFETQRHNIPIDNHLVMVNEAWLYHRTNSERVIIQVVEPATINIIHDEHVEVAVDLPSGSYRFYLLPRGIQQERDRYQWPTRGNWVPRLKTQVNP